MTRSLETHTIIWRGTTVAISYEARWLGSDGPFSMAHLQLQVIAPEGAILPVTETGYRSHFVHRAVIEDAGGPVAFATAWLDDAALSPDWKEREQASRQLALF